MSACVWRKPDARVMGTLGLLLLPLVLISQVDEQISSRPNPSLRIPAHMRRCEVGVEGRQHTATDRHAREHGRGEDSCDVDGK